MAGRTKVLFIGLDSAEPDLIDKWCESGALPNIKSLIEKSKSARLATPISFGNSVFWSSFFTGTNPAKTGHYFYRQIEPGSYRISFFDDDTDYLREPVWKMISDAGRKVAVIDMVRGPLTPTINGIQVVDWLAHDITGEPRSAPADLISDLSRVYGDDPMKGNADYAFATASDAQDFFEQIRDRINTKTDMSIDYLKQDDWDLFMTVYADPHDVGHASWHLHDPTHPRYDAALAARVGDPMEQTYKAHDEAIGRLVETVGEDTTVVLLAGPGIGPNYTASHLLDRILLAMEPSAPVKRSRILPRLRKAYRMLVPIEIRKRLRFMAMSVEEKVVGSEREHRRAFAVPHNENSGAIRLNVAGREPSGVIAPGQEYDDYCEQLSQSLLELVNVDTGGPVVDQVVRVKHDFEGDNIDYLPDLMVIWNRSAEIAGVRSPAIGEIRAKYDGTRSGDHTRNGILLTKGPGIKAGVASGTWSVMDAGATLCSMFGVSPSDSDGKPIKGMVSPP